MQLPIKIQLPEHFLEEEVRDGYTVSAQMKKVWAVEIDLLFEFMRVCDKYQLNWTASGGTVLGAVRHGGYIPWDDDIDIEMPRKDYDMLCRVIVGELEEPYFFSNGRNEKQVYRGHAQLRNGMTTGILMTQKDNGYIFNQGIFIDIFPLDNLPAEFENQNHYISQIGKQCRKTLSAVYHADCYKPRKGQGLLAYCRHFGKHCLSTISKPVQIQIMEKMWYKFRGKSSLWAILGLLPFDMNTIYDNEICYPAQMVNFEWFKIPVHKDVETYLRQCYGDWRTPVIGTSLHGSVFFDAEKSYLKYLDKSVR